MVIESPKPSAFIITGNCRLSEAKSSSWMNNDQPAHTMARFVDPACYLGLMVISLLIGLFDLQHSGEQWLEDGPRYLNNGAMTPPHAM